MTFLNSKFHHFYLPFFCLFFFFLFGPSANAQRYKKTQTVQVSFVIYPGTNVPNGIYVTGNLPSLGPWNPQQFRLFPSGDGPYVGTIKVPRGIQVNLQYTQGSWKLVETDAAGQENKVHAFFANRDTIIRYRVNHWNESQGQIRVETSADNQLILPNVPDNSVSIPVYKPPFQFVRQHSGLEAGGVKPRNITVYLPPSYENDNNQKYPVLYVLDGMQSMYTRNSINGFTWRVGDLAKSMMQSDQIREVIIVEINNQSDYQLKHFSRSMHPAYRYFLAKSVKPFIDKTYRTYSDSDNNAVLGADWLGLMSFLTAWEYPDQFSKAICLSPQFESSRHYYTFAKYVRSEENFRFVDFYMDNGSSTDEKRRQDGIDRMLETLKQKGYNPSFDLDVSHKISQYSVEQRLRNALGHFFGY